MTLASTVSASVQRAISPSVAHALLTQGWAVVDNLLGPAIADALRTEIVELHRAGGMIKNHTHLIRQGSTSLLEKSYIYEAELTLDPAAQQRAPLCAQINSDRTLATMLSLLMPSVALDSQAIKLQYNAGQGGCFPLHLDSDASVDGRLVTAIFYLNKHWSAEQGGLLRLYPWPLPPVDIAPLHDRLVLFSSRHMLHRVTPSTVGAVSGTQGEPAGDTHSSSVDGDSTTSALPSHLARCCFTIWLSQTQRVRRGRPGRAAVPAPAKPPEPEDLEGALRYLLSPAMRAHAMRLAYAEEWRMSLQQSHPPGPALDDMLSTHDAEVRIIEKALGRYKAALLHLTREPLAIASQYMQWF